MYRSVIIRPSHIAGLSATAIICAGACVRAYVRACVIASVWRVIVPGRDMALWL